MRKNLVSVVIPTYNQTNKLKRALISLEKQTYNNIEVIIIDDNINSDISSEILKIINQFNIKIIYHKNKVNLGSAKSRNEGINLASGNMITFLDDDDVYTKDKIKKQLQIMLDENSKYSVCNIALKNKKLNIRRRKYLKFDEPLINKHIKYHITGTSTMMFDAKFIKTIGGFTNIDLGDEFYLIEKAILTSKNFSHANFLGVIADVNHDEGLSSWQNKLKTENILFDKKKKYFKKINNRDIRYIKMRHFAVKAMAYKNGRKYFRMFIELTKSIFYSPINFFKLYFGKHY